MSSWVKCNVYTILDDIINIYKVKNGENPP